MKIKHLLIFNAIVAIVYGLGELLIPATMFSMHGITYSAGASLMAQYFGALLIGTGLLVWIARNVTDPEALWAIILAYFICDLIGLIVSLVGTVSGVMNNMGWVAVFVYLLLTLGYGYFLIGRLRTNG